MFCILYDFSCNVFAKLTCNAFVMVAIGYQLRLFCSITLLNVFHIGKF